VRLGGNVLLLPPPSKARNGGPGWGNASHAALCKATGDGSDVQAATTAAATSKLVPVALPTLALMPLVPRELWHPQETPVSSEHQAMSEEGDCHPTGKENADVCQEPGLETADGTSSRYRPLGLGGARTSCIRANLHAVLAGIGLAASDGLGTADGGATDPARQGLPLVGSTCSCWGLEEVLQGPQSVYQGMVPGELRSLRGEAKGGELRCSVGGCPPMLSPTNWGGVITSKVAWERCLCCSVPALTSS
jgi:hypothetical protein